MLLLTLELYLAMISALAVLLNCVSKIRPDDIAAFL